MRGISFWETKAQAALLELTILKSQLEQLNATHWLLIQPAKWHRKPGMPRRAMHRRRGRHALMRTHYLIRCSKRRRLKRRIAMLETTKLPYYQAQIDANLEKRTVWRRLLDDD